MRGISKDLNEKYLENKIKGNDVHPNFEVVSVKKLIED